MTKRHIPPDIEDPPSAIRQKQSALKRVVSSLTDEEHEKLDDEITQYLTRGGPNPALFPSLILWFICEYSNNTLKKIAMPEAISLLEEHEELRIELKAVWESKRYKSIREMGEICVNHPIFLLI